jgi:hypothetical protein
MSLSDKFVYHMIERCREDGRLAYLMGPGSEAYALMTGAYAEMRTLDAEAFRAGYQRKLKMQRVPPREE